MPSHICGPIQSQTPMRNHHSALVPCRPGPQRQLLHAFFASFLLLRSTPASFWGLSGSSNLRGTAHRASCGGRLVGGNSLGSGVLCRSLFGVCLCLAEVIDETRAVEIGFGFPSILVVSLPLDGELLRASLLALADN